jgi:sigma-54 specific flagellar transcriptional regulator A
MPIVGAGALAEGGARAWGPQDAPAGGGGSAAGAPGLHDALPGDGTLVLRTALENLERLLIDRALSRAGGNRTEAAALLGLNRTTLVEKLRKYAA